MYEDLEDQDIETDQEDEKDDTCLLMGTFKTENIPVSVTGCAGADSFDVRV